MAVPLLTAGIRRRLRSLAAMTSVGLYTLLAPFGYLTFAGLCWCWRRRPVVRARRLQRCTAVGFRVMHDWLRVVGVAHFDYRRALPPLPEPCVVVANHPTQMDITSITASLGGGCTVVKSSVYRRRLIRPLMVGAGHLEGAGSDLISIGAAVEAGVERCRQGLRVIIFPEGSRSPPGRLRPFGRMAFEIACRARVPLVTIAIRCEPVYLSREVTIFRPPEPIARLELQLLAIDDPGDVGYDSRMLREKVRRRLQEFVGAGGSERVGEAGVGVEAG